MDRWDEREKHMAGNPWLSGLAVAAGLFMMGVMVGVILASVA